MGPNFSEKLIESYIFHSRKCIWICDLDMAPILSRPQCAKPRSHCADLEVSTIWKIVENGLVGSWSHGNIVLPSWKSAQSGNDRHWSGSQYDKLFFIVKLCRVDCGCSYDLFMDRFQSCVESETSWDCRTQREGIRGQRVGIRGQRMDGREYRTNITIASCLISVTFTFSCISRYAYISVCMYIF